MVSGNRQSDLRKNSQTYREKRRASGDVSVTIWVPQKHKGKILDFAEKLRSGELEKELKWAYVRIKIYEKKIQKVLKKTRGKIKKVIKEEPKVTQIPEIIEEKLPQQEKKQERQE